MTKKADLEGAISKRHDTDLWREIRTLYESKTQPSYKKIKEILCAEFNLDSFPSQRTIQRRSVNEGWKKYDDDQTVKIAPNKYSDDFWICVRNVYETNSRITYKRLKETVQNELQCTDFPAQDAVSAKAEQEGWKRADKLVKKSDADLKKISGGVKKIMSMDDAKASLEDQKNEEDQEDENVDGNGQVVPFDFIQELVNNEKANIKNLLMTSQVRRQKQADVIVKARKRMAVTNMVGDQIGDAFTLLFALFTSEEIERYFTKKMMRDLKDKLYNLKNLSSAFNELSFNRRENLKFELSLYGVQMEDLKDVDDAKRMTDLNDDTAYEAQRERLRLEAKRIAERRRYIDSGALEEEVNEEMERRMNESQIEDGEYEDAEFEEIEG